MNITKLNQKEIDSVCGGVTAAIEFNIKRQLLMLIILSGLIYMSFFTIGFYYGHQNKTNKWPLEAINTLVIFSLGIAARIFYKKVIRNKFPPNS